MKKIISILTLLIALQGYSQTIDKIVDDKIAAKVATIPATKTNVDSSVKAEIAKFIQVVGLDTFKIRKLNSAAVLDTLVVPVNDCFIFEIVLTGMTSCVRIAAVTNKAGVYTVRFVDQLSLSAATGVRFTVSVILNKVIVKTEGATGNYTYQKSRKNIL